MSNDQDAAGYRVLDRRQADSLAYLNKTFDIDARFVIYKKVVELNRGHARQLDEPCAEVELVP